MTHLIQKVYTTKDIEQPPPLVIPQTFLTAPTIYYPNQSPTDLGTMLSVITSRVIHLQYRTDLCQTQM